MPIEENYTVWIIKLLKSGFFNVLQSAPKMMHLLWVVLLELIQYMSVKLTKMQNLTISIHENIDYMQMSSIKSLKRMKLRMNPFPTRDGSQNDEISTSLVKLSTDLGND